MILLSLKITRASFSPHDKLSDFFHSVKRCNCYMVCAGEATGLSQSRRSSGLEIGCLIDIATGLLTFTSSGVEMANYYQVSHTGMDS